MQDRSPGMLKAALIGGGLMGLAGALPFVGLLNAACCSLFIAAGFLAAYLYGKQCSVAGVAFGAGQGAWVGLIAGLIYTVATTLVGLVVQRISGNSVEQVLEQMEGMGGMDPHQIEQVRQSLESIGPAGLMVFVIVAAVFSTLGGTIGGLVFKHEPPAPAVPPQIPGSSV